MSAAVYAVKRDHSIFNNVIAAAEPTAMLPLGRCHVTLSPVKNYTPAMRPFVKILRPLVCTM